jgi:hypothetical protein
MVGNNPIVLVGTKMDLLPPGCKPKEVADWLAEAAARKKLVVTSSHLVSSHTGQHDSVNNMHNVVIFFITCSLPMMLGHLA